MTLNQVIVHTFKWYKKLTKRFIDLAFLPTTMVVIATLFSQLFMLLSSMMPLKVIMLLGSPVVPSYFPLSWQSISRDTLVIYLAIASVGFFLFYLLSERIIDIYSQKGSDKILKNNKKVVLFEKQDIFAQNSYTKLSKSLSNIIFFILSLVGLGVVYPLLSLVILLFVAVTYIIFSQMHIIENLNKLLDLAKGIGFFIVFAFILTSFIVNFYPPEIIIVILSVLLIRQMLAKLSDAIRDIVSLYKNRQKVNSLFFFSHTRVAIPHDKHNPFWNLIEKSVMYKWSKELLTNMTNNDVKIENIILHQANMKNIMFLKVTTSNETYLLKLYNKNISSQAIHESSLLEENNILSHLPFVGSTFVEEYHCNIFGFNDIKTLTQKQFNIEHMTVKINMMSIKPSQELEERYSRSHPYLYQRLDRSIFDKLYLVFDNDELDLVKKLEDNFDNIINTIKKLPLQLINSTMTKYSLVKNEDKLSLLHWGSWKIDTIGVNYPIAIAQIDRLKKEFKSLQNKRADLVDVSIKNIILMSLMSQFEKLYNGENFTGVIEVVPRILECISDEK